MSQTRAQAATPAVPWRATLASFLLLPALAFGLFNYPAAAQEAPVVIPAPAVDLDQTSSSAKAVFAGGCFWGVQGVFQHVKGVTRAVSGYSGGSAETATYELSSTGTSGHAESVEVTYDPSVISYGELLHIYFSVAHNPTQLNFQGPDQGTQYRSTIFALNEDQAKTAEAYINQLNETGLFEGPIVTTIEQLQAFYPAEQYHQDFLTLNPTWPYIVVHDLPKIEALRTIFPAEFREEPVLVGTL
jgi:peptide-methionine (S)-S-oxide reductase